MENLGRFGGSGTINQQNTNETQLSLDRVQPLYSPRQTKQNTLIPLPLESGGNCEMDGHLEGEGMQAERLRKDQIGEVLVFKKLALAEELMQSLPIKFRKKLRQVIDSYQKERFEHELRIRELLKENEHSMRELELRSKVILPAFEPNSVQQQNSKDTNSLSTQDVCKRFNEGSIPTMAEGQRYQQIVKMNQMINFLDEGYGHEKVHLFQQIANLKAQAQRKERDVEKGASMVWQLNGTIVELKKQIEDRKEELRLQALTVQTLEEKGRALERVNSEIQKSVKQKKQTRTEGRSSESLDDDQRNFPILKVSTVRKLSDRHCRSPTGSDRSPRSPTRTRKISLRDTLCKSKDVLTPRHQQEQLIPSECDSIEFGKQKVTEKRKMRKIFGNLLSACSAQEKREALEKLAMEINLKSKDFQGIFKLF